MVGGLGWVRGMIVDVREGCMMSLTVCNRMFL